LLPLTGDTVVVVNFSPSLLLVLHTRDPLASSIVVPGPMFPVFATGAGGGAGAGAAAGGVAAGAVVGCDGAGAVATGSVREPPRGAGSVRAGARYSGAPRRDDPLRDVELGDAGATAGAGGVSDLWKTPSWLKPVTAAVIDPTSAAVAVRYPGAV
jgi:hypothetical protein